MFKEFKAFIAKGNVIDLAVAVIIAGAFGAIVSSLTDDIIMPVIGAIFGGADFSSYFILLSTPEGYDGSLTDYAALKEAGAAMIGYGAFVTAIINFVILAFIIFLLVRYTSDDRDRAEARFVTRVLITVGLLLKLADIGMTVAVYTICFPDSATPPYENFMSMTQCAGTIQNPACPFMDFFALYGIYAVLKVREQVSE